MPFNLFKTEGSSSKGKKKQDDRDARAAFKHEDQVQRRAFFCEVQKCSFDEMRLERWFRAQEISTWKGLAIRIRSLNNPDILPINAIDYTGHWTGSDKAKVTKFACQMCVAWFSSVYLTTFLDADTRNLIEAYKSFHRECFDSNSLLSTNSSTTGTGYLPNVRCNSRGTSDNAQYYTVDLSRRSRFLPLQHMHVNTTTLHSISE